MIWLWHDIKSLWAENKLLGIKKVTINGWENSTFVWRSGGEWSKFCDTTNGGPTESDELKNSTDLIIYMTEEMRSKLRKKRGGGLEAVMTVEEEYPLVDDLAKAVRENLGIHENGVEGERKLNCRIVEPKDADVDVAIEVNNS